MSTYSGSFRSNYFRVTDAKKLKDIIDHTESFNASVELYDNHDGRWYIRGGGCDWGIGLPHYDDNGEYDGICGMDLYKALQKIVAQDDAIIIIHIGREGYRYSIAYAVVITRKHIEYIDLEKEVMVRARIMLDNPNWDTQLWW